MPFWQLQEWARLGAESCFSLGFYYLLRFSGCLSLPSSSPLLHHYPLFSFHQPCTDPTQGRETTGSTWHLPEISLAKTLTAEPCYKLCAEPFNILLMYLVGWGGDGAHAGPLLLLQSHLPLIPGSAQSSPEEENPTPPHTYPSLGITGLLRFGQASLRNAGLNLLKACNVSEEHG